MIMKLYAIVQANVVRPLRDRLGLFFLVLMPLILIVVLGIMYGGSNTARIGIVDADGGPLARELVAAVGQGLQAVLYQIMQELTKATDIGLHRGQALLQAQLPAHRDMVPIEIQHFIDKRIEIQGTALQLGRARILGKGLHHLLHGIHLLNDGGSGPFQ